MQEIDISSKVKIIILGLDNDIEVGELDDIEEMSLADHDLSIFVRETISMERYDIEIVEVREGSTKESILKEIFRAPSILEYETLVIHDMTGGNPVSDISSLLELKEKEKNFFAIGFIKPLKSSRGIGCWAFDEGIVSSIYQDEDFDIRVRILDLARRERLQLYKVDQG